MMDTLRPGFESGAYPAPAIAALYDLARGAEGYAAVARGTRGRIVLTMGEGFTKLIGEETDVLALRRQGVADGMKPLRTAGAIKIAAGATSVDEVLRAAPLA